MKKYLLFAIMLCYQLSQAQLSGTYTIGGATPDYNNFTTAIAALVSDGISGNVTFNVRDGIYNESFVLAHIQGTSATRSITFQSESGNNVACRLETASNGSTPLWLMSKTWYVNWIGIGFRNSSPVSSSGLVVVDTGICRKLNFVNCHFSSASPNTEKLILVNTDNIYDFTVQNSYFDSSFSAIYLNAEFGGTHVSITGSTFQSTQEAIHTINCNWAYIANNIIHNPLDAGIFIDQCDTIRVLNNEIDNAGYAMKFNYINVAFVQHNRITGNNSNGIYFDNAFAEPIAITHNYMENVVYGIYVQGGVSSEIAYDTIIHSTNAIEQDYTGAVNAHHNLVQDYNGVGMFFYNASNKINVHDNYLKNDLYNNPNSIGIYWDCSTGSTNYADTATIINNILLGGNTSLYGIRMSNVAVGAGHQGIVGNNEVSSFLYGIHGAGVKNVAVSFNTVYQTGLNLPVLTLTTSSGNEVSNNVFYGKSTSSNYNLMDVENDTLNNFDYNIYYYNDTGVNMNLLNLAHSLGDWQIMNHDSHSHFIDPVFMNAPFNLYAYNCILSQKGLPMNALRYDITGLMRDSIFPTPGSYEILINVAVANFGYTTDSTAISFQSSSVNAIYYAWNFGDGDTSVLQNPVHTYGAIGTYTVQLIASSPCNTDSITQTVVVTNDTSSSDTTETGIHLITKATSINIYPNPASASVAISMPDSFGEGEFALRIFDNLGKMVQSQQIVYSNSIPVNIENLSAGIYYVQIGNSTTTYMGKMIKQ